jgi:dephospho-CoA kinase
LHPQIKARLEAQVQKYAAENRRAVVLDAPLLLEAGWGPMCNLVVLVDASREARLHRGRQRGWTEADFDRREAAQWTVEEKRRHAHVVLPNDGTEAELKRVVEQFWQEKIVCRPPAG